MDLSTFNTTADSETSTIDLITSITTTASTFVNAETFNETSIIDLVTSITTTASTGGSAYDFNEKTFYLRVPTIVFLSALMPIGILGNAAVIFIFGFYIQKSNVQFFAVILAVFDIITCLIGVPLELTEMVHMHTFPSEGLCKLERLVNYSCSIGSALVLFSISIERYIKVCRPHGQQMTPRLCRVLALVISIVSVPLATPIAISYGRHPMIVSGNITVHQCAYHYSLETFVYYAGFLPVCIAILITMFVLYSCVLHSAVLHFRKLEERRQAKKGTNKARPKRMVSRTSSAVICLTVVYALAFTPTLIIGIISKNYTNVDSTSPLQGAVTLLYRSWVINSSINPIIYGFFNKAYRKIFLKMMSRIPCLGLPKYPRRKSRDLESVENDLGSTSAIGPVSESTIDRAHTL